MATCPYCLAKTSEKANVCDICGAEKGYISVFDKTRGAGFIVVWGLLLPLLLEVTLIILTGNDMLWLGVSFVLLSIVLLSAYKLASGPAWYR